MAAQTLQEAYKGIQPYAREVLPSSLDLVRRINGVRQRHGLSVIDGIDPESVRYKPTSAEATGITVFLPPNEPVVTPYDRTTPVLQRVASSLPESPSKVSAGKERHAYFVRAERPDYSIMFSSPHGRFDQADLRVSLPSAEDAYILVNEEPHRIERIRMRVASPVFEVRPSPDFDGAALPKDVLYNHLANLFVGLDPRLQGSTLFVADFQNREFYVNHGVWCGELTRDTGMSIDEIVAELSRFESWNRVL